MATRRFCKVTGLAILAVVTTTLLGITPDEVQTDLQKLEDLNVKLEQGALKEFTPYFNVINDEMWDSFEKLQKQYAEFARSDLQELEQTLQAFREKYGQDAASMDARIQEILGKPPTRRPSWLIEELSDALEKMQAFPNAMAEKLIEIETRNLEHMDRFSPSIRAKKFDECQRALKLALAYVPDHDVAQAHLKELSGKRKEALAEVEKAIDEKEWPGHSPKFNGPGNPNALTREAKKFLSVDDNGNQTDDVLAVRISGDWRVAEETLLGPKNYGLPVHVAYRIKDEPENAKVLQLTLITRDAEMSPPFQTYWVGDNWKIRRHKVSDAGAGGPDLVFRFVLAAVLILSGLLAAAPFLRTRTPFLTPVLAALAPVRGVVGVVTLAVGCLFLLLSLLSPFSHLLPQIFAILVGLFLGLELLLRTPKATAPPPIPNAPSPELPPMPDQASTSAPPPLPPEASTPPPVPPSPGVGDAARKAGQAAGVAAVHAQDFLRKHQDKVRRLERYQVPIGLGCLVFGLLHLVIGGVVLF